METFSDQRTNTPRRVALLLLCIFVIACFGVVYFVGDLAKYQEAISAKESQTALRGVNDYPRAGRLGLALDRLLLLQVEETPEQGILQQGVVLANPTAHRDADNTRGHPAHDRGDGLHWSAAHFGYRRPRERRARDARHQSDPA